MKQIVPWLKAHWPIPALTLIALAALPTAMYFAGKMQDEFHADYQKKVTEAAASVSASAAVINYGVPDMRGDGMVLERKAPANEQLIGAYKRILEDMQAKVGVVSEKGLNFNKGDHVPLMEGFFPGASPDWGRAFVKKYMDFHQKLVADMRGGDPARPEEIAQHLADYRDAAVARIRAELGRDPNPEEQAKLAEELTQMRIGAVRKRAGEIQVYADPSVFDGVPVSVPEKAPSATEAWDKQERAWVHQDICRAIFAANGGATATGGVGSSVVKRLLRVSVAPVQLDAAAVFDPGEEKAPLNFGVSLTGRTSGPSSKNKWYDVRPTIVEVIVSSRNLPRFLNALAATNFMTVLDLDLARIEPLADMKEGYDYGDEHVVRATMKIETVWLREWRKPFMPIDVQRALGMVDGVDAGHAGDAPAPAPRRPPPNPPGGRPGPGGRGGDLGGG
ncbi:MAG TPA: hypothetical protein PKE29_11075 [Phycisphaerales bacterium]|nr:hypothetical protein [Phycisphaerales bacterium]